MRTAAFALLLSIPLATLAEEPSGFREIVAQRQRDLAREIAAWLQANPQAKDAEAAGEWLIKYAQQSGQEAEVVAALETFLARDGLDAALRAQGQQALCIGLARSERVAQALDVLDLHLRSVRQSSATRSLEFAHQLATHVRVAGDFESSKAVYRRVVEAFPFSPVVGEIADARMAKIDLAGKPAPPLKAQDLKGQPFSLDAWNGKVVVVDFWATNCPPCLEEMPRMKALYAEFHEQGLEIVGVSLDERQTLVDDYVEQTGVAWPMVLNRQPEGSLAEKYSVVTIPSLFVIDGQGKVAQVDVYGDTLRSVVKNLLKRP